MFAVIFICGNLFLPISVKTQKLKPTKISCHRVGSVSLERRTRGPQKVRVKGWNHLPEMTCILQKFSSLMILIPPLFA